jgi:hypothetical protein
MNMLEIILGDGSSYIFKMDDIKLIQTDTKNQRLIIRNSLNDMYVEINTSDISHLNKLRDKIRDVYKKIVHLSNDKQHTYEHKYNWYVIDTNKFNEEVTE